MLGYVQREQSERSRQLSRADSAYDDRSGPDPGALPR